jgi:flavin-dependent dehydrogenase
MQTDKPYDAVIVGGGLAGLICANLLSKSGYKVLVAEKKNYPFHKVCGEYVSNEVLGFLRSLGFDPFAHGASSINKLRISSPKGKNISCTLKMGGFGLSRYTMDHALAELATKNGATLLSGVQVNNIKFLHNHFDLELSSSHTIQSTLVIGSYGKRDKLDKKLDRGFIAERSPYMAVKYHLRTGYPPDEVGLDNFPGGYCGIVKIEEDKYNLCYLYKRDPSAKFNSVFELEEKVLYQNPLLKRIFMEAGFIREKPEVISEISFEPKQQIEDHVLMCGDSAGLITPLCGNGMAMAIRAAKMLSELIIRSDIRKHPHNRKLLEESWKQLWSSEFGTRLKWGRVIQSAFGKPAVTGIALHTIHAVPPLERYLISKTHGQPL